MSRGMWKAVEASVGEVRLGETEEGESKEGSRKEMREKRKKEIEERKNGKGQEDSKGVGDLGQRRGGSKIRSRSKENGI